MSKASQQAAINAYAAEMFACNGPDIAFQEAERAARSAKSGSIRKDALNARAVFEATTPTDVQRDLVLNAERAAQERLKAAMRRIQEESAASWQRIVDRGR